MTELKALKQAADDAGAAFDKACKPHYADGRWGYYRAVECGQTVADSVESAFNAYHAATYAFYAAREPRKQRLPRFARAVKAHR